MLRQVVNQTRSKGMAAFAPSARAMSLWSHVELGPKDPILGVTEAYKADSHPDKVNLGVGAYRDNNGLPVVLKSVDTAQRRILDSNLDNEYAPIGGQPNVSVVAANLAFGENCAPILEGRNATLQSLSGTGALRLIGAFLNRFKPLDVYLPDPTWGNHIPIFQDAGLTVRKYRYYDPATGGVNFSGLLEDVAKAPNGSAFLLHACAHNPTGADPNEEQWKELSRAMKKKDHFAIFDSAYQGFASGDPVRDARSISIFVEDGHQIALAQSFAKNFGLYGHRVGAATFICDSPDEKARVDSQLKILARAMYSSPPIQGARIVTTIMEDAELKNQWYTDVKEMAERIIDMRSSLRAELEKIGSTRDWSRITNQIGMFCYSGMTADQVAKLASEHHIYLTSNGRISMAGLTDKSIPYLANAIHDVTK